MCSVPGGSQAARLPATVQVGPSSGFSLIMVRLVSRLMRTVESKGIWNAVRRYCVRTMGRSCFVSICCWISANSLQNFSISSALLPCAPPPRPPPCHQGSRRHARAGLIWAVAEHDTHTARHLFSGHTGTSTLRKSVKHRTACKAHSGMNASVLASCRRTCRRQRRARHSTGCSAAACSQATRARLARLLLMFVNVNQRKTLRSQAPAVLQPTLYP